MVNVQVIYYYEAYSYTYKQYAVFQIGIRISNARSFLGYPLFVGFEVPKFYHSCLYFRIFCNTENINDSPKQNESSSNWNCYSDDTSHDYKNLIVENRLSPIGRRRLLKGCSFFIFTENNFFCNLTPILCVEPKSMIDDATLIKRIRAGDRHAFQWLIKSNERLVYGVVWKIVRNGPDTEDIAQDVFLKVYEKLDTFNLDSKLSTWIAKIAYNQALSHLRKRDILQNSADVQDEVLNDTLTDFSVATPANYLEEKELKTVVHEAIEKLPLPYRTLIDLFHIQEMSYAEIVEISGFPEGTVKSYLFRGRKLLKDAIRGSKHLLQ